MTRRILLLLAMVGVGASGLHAQELVRIESRVVSVSGDSIYLDRGRQAGVAPDDRVVLYPPGSATVDAVVRDVSKSTSRAELSPGSGAVPVGTRAEILVPKERLEAKEKPANPEPATPPSPSGVGPAPPQHPPWTHPPENWVQDSPLLAQAFSSSSGGRAADREPQFSGRVYWQMNDTLDRQNGQRQYLFGSLGSDLHLEHPFGRAGSFDFQTDVFHNAAILPDAPDDSSTTLSVRRLSYFEGGTPDDPTRWEVGRFLQHEFPELGTVDGVDWSRRTQSGSRFGANVGGMPDPFIGMHDSQDSQASLYGRWVADRSGRLALGGAYQNTWHEGKQDRNLFLGTLDYVPRPGFSLRSAVWVDYYGAGDTIKSHGFELTELQTQAFWSFMKSGGFGISLSHRRIPELLRDEFPITSTDLIKHGKYDRVGVNGWHALGEHTRLSARADLWQDQSDNGLRGEVGMAWRDLLYRRGEVGVAVFTVDGSFSSGEGLRLSASKTFDRAFGTLAYELATFDQPGFAGTQSTLAHHDLFGSLDLDLGKKWSLSILGDKRFGDQQDAYTLGLLLQLRF
jgi:hypothetical protein